MKLTCAGPFNDGNSMRFVLKSRLSPSLLTLLMQLKSTVELRQPGGITQLDRCQFWDDVKLKMVEIAL